MKIELIRWGGKRFVEYRSDNCSKNFQKGKIENENSGNMGNTVQRWFRIREAWPDDASGANRAFA